MDFTILPFTKKKKMCLYWNFYLKNEYAMIVLFGIRMARNYTDKYNTYMYEHAEKKHRSLTLTPVRFHIKNRQTSGMKHHSHY